MPCPPSPIGSGALGKEGPARISIFLLLLPALSVSLPGHRLIGGDYLLPHPSPLKQRPSGTVPPQEGLHLATTEALPSFCQRQAAASVAFGAPASSDSLEGTGNSTVEPKGASHSHDLPLPWGGYSASILATGFLCSSPLSSQASPGCSWLLRLLEDATIMAHRPLAAPQLLPL